MSCQQNCGNLSVGNVREQILLSTVLECILRDKLQSEKREELNTSASGSMLEVAAGYCKSQGAIARYELCVAMCYT